MKNDGNIHGLSLRNENEIDISQHENGQADNGQQEPQEQEPLDALKRCITPLGLDMLLLPSDLDAQEWLTFGSQLAVVRAPTQWSVGDWALRSETTVGHGYYTRLERLTGLGYGTLANYKYTARAFPFSLRSESASWSIHRALAPLMKGDQAMALDMLARAGIEGWTVERSKAEVARALQARVEAGVTASRQRRAQPARRSPAVATIPISTVDAHTAASQIRALCTSHFVARLRDALGVPDGGACPVCPVVRHRRQ
jgi:hypothetical protein